MYKNVRNATITRVSPATTFSKGLIAFISLVENKFSKLIRFFKYKLIFFFQIPAKLNILGIFGGIHLYNSYFKSAPSIQIVVVSKFKIVSFLFEI